MSHRLMAIPMDTHVLILFPVSLSTVTEMSSFHYALYITLSFAIDLAKNILTGTALDVYCYVG